MRGGKMDKMIINEYCYENTKERFKSAMFNNDRLVIPVSNVLVRDKNIVGNKAYNLSRVISIDQSIKIPCCAVVTTNSYHEFLSILFDDNSVDYDAVCEFIKKIDESNAESIRYNREDLEHISSIIQDSIINSDIFFGIMDEIRQQSVIMRRYSNFEDSFSYAVRSSSVFEDSDNASFAGQYVSFLDITQDIDLFIKKCWASLFNIDSLLYAKACGVKAEDIIHTGMGVIIQRMVKSNCRGVVFSIDPIYKLSNTMVIDIKHNKSDYIVRYNQLTKSVTVICSEENAKNNDYIVSVSHKVVDIVNKLVKQMKVDLDIEWVIENNDVVVLQVRPITNNSCLRRDIIKHNKSYSKYIEGIGASEGTVSGRACEIPDINEFINNNYGISPDDIIVADMVPASFVISRSIKGLITRLGGTTSHLAIVCRELGIPYVAGVGDSVNVISNGKTIEINGNTGKISYDLEN